MFIVAYVINVLIVVFKVVVKVIVKVVVKVVIDVMHVNQVFVTDIVIDDDFLVLRKDILATN